MPESSAIMPFEATETTLANGLRVIVVPTGFPNLVSMQIPVQTGSRNEVEAGKSGFAHFFEHMMFRGTDAYPADAYQEVITRSGARQNAYTTDDYTNYHVTFAAEDLETILRLEADRFMNLNYSEEGFKTEARAVLGEYNKNSADPLNKLIEVQRDRAFQTHTYKHTTMGFVADIEDMPNQIEYSRAFFQRWYRPKFTSIIIAGEVDPAATTKLVEEIWGGWESGTPADVAIPPEPQPEGPLFAHVPWPSPTLSWVSVGFHAPAFSATEREFAALDTLLDLSFGETSDLYHRLVEEEQVVDQLFPYYGAQVDPSLATIFARVKEPSQMAYVRDAILSTVDEIRAKPVDGQRLEDAKAHARYSFSRTLDNSESVAGTLARFVQFERRYDTLNELFERFAELTPEDLAAASDRYLRRSRMVVATLSQSELPSDWESLPAASGGDARPSLDASRFLIVKSPSTLLRMKLLFAVGSASDPAGREGLAEMTAAMVTEAGSVQMRTEEISRALFPLAGSFGAQVDKEMTTLTGVIHRDNIEKFAKIALPQLMTPGWREDDFERIKDIQLNALVQDLCNDNEEELGKERLQANVFAETRYAHPSLGTQEGIAAITLDDVKAAYARLFTQANLTVGLIGDVPESFIQLLREKLAALPAGTETKAAAITGRRPDAIEVEIIKKETRATAISFGHPIEVTRTHPDFAALWLARSWFGEHRASNGRLFTRLREIRGLNYGDYAYVEAFPGGMYGFFPSPNLARRAQIFEVWIRPVPPEQAVFALKLGIHELDRLIREGLSEDEFAATREYLMKNVFVTTKTQDQQLGYALDSRWFGLPEYTSWMREQLMALSREQVNEAVRRHLSATNLSVVMVTNDAKGLRKELLSTGPTSITYDAPKPQEILDEDVVVGQRELGIGAERIRMTDIGDVFRT